MRKCKNCGKDIPNRNVYCNNTCQAHFQSKKKVKLWLEGKNFIRGGGASLPRWMRTYLMEEVNQKCQSCGWGEINPHTGNVSLEIDHIDGDALNNSKDNLRVLCPNCHSLTKTYKNSGGRKSSRTYRGISSAG